MRIVDGRMSFKMVVGDLKVKKWLLSKPFGTP